MKRDARCHGCHSAEPSTYNRHGEMLCEPCDALDDRQLASLQAERQANDLLRRCHRLPRVLSFLSGLNG